MVKDYQTVTLGCGNCSTNEAITFPAHTFSGSLPCRECGEPVDIAEPIRKGFPWCPLCAYDIAECECEPWELERASAYWASPSRGGDMTISQRMDSQRIYLMNILGITDTEGN